MDSSSARKGEMPSNTTYPASHIYIYTTCIYSCLPACLPRAVDLLPKSICLPGTNPPTRHHSIFHPRQQCVCAPDLLPKPICLPGTNPPTLHPTIYHLVAVGRLCGWPRAIERLSLCVRPQFWCVLARFC